jgi:hypothetical protein
VRDVPETAGIAEPLPAVKYVAVLTWAGRLRLGSTTVWPGSSRTYDVDAHAFCRVGGEHPVPDWHCTCGFYAVADDEHLRDLFGRDVPECWAHATVELSGRVVEHERGWRAAHQVVLGVSWPDRCQCCHRAPADGFLLPHRDLQPIVPACRACAGEHWISVAETTNRLGTEVRLVPSDAGPTAPATGALRPARRRRQRWWTPLQWLVPGVLLAALLIGILVAANRGARADGSVPAELGALVKVNDPQGSADRLAQGFDGADRRAVVLVDRDRNGTPLTVSAVAVLVALQGGGWDCLTARPSPAGGSTGDASWSLARTGVTGDEATCIEASRQRTPLPARPTATGASPAPAAPAPASPAPAAASPAAASPAAASPASAAR